MFKDRGLFEVVNLLSQLTVFESYNFELFLRKLIKLLIKIIPVDSCLIYFYDRDKKGFILIASKKSKKKLIGKITIKRGEGITGWTALHRQTVFLTKKAYLDKRFKLFKELPEDKYEAFLSVPIIDKSGVVGVINLQNRAPYVFSPRQIKLAETIVKIIATAFEGVVLGRKVGYLENKLEERKLIEKAKGILMKEKNISEEVAYKLIRKEAMSKRKPMKDIAEAVLLIWS